MDERIEHRVVSSLDKCFWDTAPYDYEILDKASALKGERFSFQICFRACDPSIGSKLVAYAKVNSDLKDCISISTVENVAVRFPTYRGGFDENYLRTEPGMYPDILVPADEKRELYFAYNDLRSIWITTEIPVDCVPGNHIINVSFTDGGEYEFFSESFTLNVIDAVMPEQTFYCTEWFHADCLADYYNVPVWSERHWEICKNFIATSVKNGNNTILTPVFTPPLDTAIGHERTTVQLVDVYNKCGEWSFGFERLERWIDICLECNAKHLEISHLFTQWGATHAPKIFAYVDGEYKKVFGWETDSQSDEYKSFLRSFLSALVHFLKQKRVAEMCLFHISDEPSIEMLENYKKARAIVDPYLSEFKIIDALSDYEFYKTGAVKNPIPANDAINEFLENNVPNLWVYYCCGQGYKVSNRFIAMPGARTRIMGIQMFKYDIEGFLQWGYNFYNSQGSLQHINPYIVNDGEYFYPAGDGFSVYPAADGNAYESIRLRYFEQGIEDMRALQLASDLCGTEKVKAMIDEGLETPVTFENYPHTNNYIQSLREKINTLIAENK